MMGLIGRKVGMTQIFDEKGEAIPVTVIEAGPCTVSEVRSAERNGYQAIQLGFGTNLESRFSRPVLGQFKKRNLPPARHLSRLHGLPDRRTRSGSHASSAARAKASLAIATDEAASASCRSRTCRDSSAEARRTTTAASVR